MNTALESETIESVLLTPSAFIVIDSYGIGAHGEEHIRFDKKCESKGCFVIENVTLSNSLVFSLSELKISFDKASSSTGRRCLVTAVYV